MTAPITPPPPINTLISIQPVSTSVAGRDATAMQQSLLALFSDGTVLRGYVINRDAQNNPIIRTERGDFVVKSDVFIKTGSEIALRVDTAQPSQARIVSIDHLSPEEYSVQNVRSGISEDTIEEAQFKALSQTMRPGTAGPVQTQPQQTTPLPVLRAVILQPSPQLTLAPAPSGATVNPVLLPTLQSLQKLATGTPLSITVYDVKLPPVPVAVSALSQPVNLNVLQSPNAPSASPPAQQAAEPAAAFVKTPTATTAAPTAAAPAYAQPPSTAPLPSLPAPLAAALFASQPAATNPATPPTTVPTQASATATPVITLPATTTVPLKPAAPSAQLSATLPMFEGTVIGHAEDGSNIIHTPFASMKLYTTQPLPTGTNLALIANSAEPESPVFSPFTAPAMAAPDTPPPDFKYLLPAVSRLISADPALAKDFTQQLPVIGPRFTSGLLFFLAAVKSGDRRGITNALETARLEALIPGVLSQLSKDIRELQQQFLHPRTEEWKPIELPIIFQNAVQTARLYIRQEHEETVSSIEKTNAGNRFLLDLHLSELGDMQLDGFVRKAERGNSLELFLRAAETLEPAIMQDIRDLFANTTEATGLTGNLVFQQGAEHFVRPQPKTPEAKGPESPHTILA